jgi:hypothetical protein
LDSHDDMTRQRTRISTSCFKIIHFAILSIDRIIFANGAREEETNTI